MEPANDETVTGGFGREMAPRTDCGGLERDDTQSDPIRKKDSDEQGEPKRKIAPDDHTLLSGAKRLCQSVRGVQRARPGHLYAASRQIADFFLATGKNHR